MGKVDIEPVFVRARHNVGGRDQALDRLPAPPLVAAHGVQGSDRATSRTLAAGYGPRIDSCSAIAELSEDRVVEGVTAVARKRRLRARSGSDYLALELVDPTSHPGACLARRRTVVSRFAEGDAVRVLGRVERPQRSFS